jgi:thymidylate synthase (methanogen type)
MDSIHIVEKTIGEAWLSALLKTMLEGREIKTQYDKEGELPSRDVASLIEVTDPLPEGVKLKYPNVMRVIHRGDVRALKVLEGGYIDEVLRGTNDHFIIESDTSFPYTYHDRLFSYRPFNSEDETHVEHNVEVRDVEIPISSIKFPCTRADGEPIDSLWKREEEVLRKVEEITEIMDGESRVSATISISSIEFPGINQVEEIINGLEKSPHTRRMQCVTWRPLSDLYRDEPPCLRCIWVRVINDELFLHAHWRSRDLFNAWEANVVAMVAIQKYIAGELVKRGVKIDGLHFVDVCDSLHVYSRNFKEVLRLFETAIKRGKLDPSYLVKIEDLKEKYGFLE